MLAGAAALASPPRRDRSRPRAGESAPPGRSVEALLARMTLEEKAGQLTLMASAQRRRRGQRAQPAQPQRLEQQLAAARAGQFTGIFNGAGSEWHGQLQQAAMESRLGIPLLFAADVIHGFRTVFPVPLGEAASFEPALAERTARAAAVEAAAAGIAWTFAPMVDIARDARWGRSVEGAGEDVLVGRLSPRHGCAASRVPGLDRDDASLACAKHFAPMAPPRAGSTITASTFPNGRLREIYFPPFHAAVEAGAGTVMAGFNELSGIPATANRWLLPTCCAASGILAASSSRITPPTRS